MPVPDSRRNVPSTTDALFAPSLGRVSRLGWTLSSSSDKAALAVVDGTGAFEGLGPHYSRRTPGAKTFTGCGQEIVLLSECGRAVWAVVYQCTPAARGTGASRGRIGATDLTRYLWRNMMFRNLGAGLSSELIATATERTYEEWEIRYGSLPAERLRTEIDIAAVRSTNPGYCYLMAGWERGETVRGKLYLYAPERVAANKAARPAVEPRKPRRATDGPEAPALPPARQRAPYIPSLEASPPRGDIRRRGEALLV